MKKLFALLITVSMLVSVVPVVSFADAAAPTLDTLLGNELTNGTFEAGIDGWTATDTTPSAEIANTSKNSAGAMKLTGAGTVSTTASLYPQEVYDVSVWAKPVGASATVTVKVGDDTVINQTVTTSTNLTGKIKMAGTTGNGNVINASENTVSVTVDGDCYIDDVIVKEAEEKIIAITSGLTEWAVGSAGTGTMSYDETMCALKLDTSKNAKAVQYIAVEKGVTYAVSADIYLDSTAATNNALYLYWSSADRSRVIKKAALAQEFKTFTWNIDNVYPETGDDGDMAGIYFSIGGAANSTFYLKNVSIKEDKTGETVYAAPSITLTADKVDTVAPVVTPTVDSGDTAYYMYRYSQDGLVKETGFGATVPTYTVADGFEGTLSLDVTPVNSQGTYGETKTVNLVYEAAQLVNNGVADLDAALGNKILKGTFENGMPGWTLSGVTMTEETENAAAGSFKAAKLTGSGTVKIDATVFENELYDVNLSVKPVSDNVNVTLTVDFGNGLTKGIFNETVTAGNWTKLTEKLSRYSGSYKNTAAETAAAVFTLEISGDCYIDEFTVTPSENMLLLENGVRVYGENDNITEVGGYIKRGDITLTEADGVIKGEGMYQADRSAAQYVVYEKGNVYRLTADVKKVAESTNASGRVYLDYDDRIENFTLTDSWQTITYDIDATALANNYSATSVIFSGQRSAGKADMEIKNASLVKVKKFTKPSATVAIPASVVQGQSVAATTVANFTNGDGVGYKYCYKLDGKTVANGFATGDNIPAYTSAMPGSLTLTVIPVNSEGTYGDVVTSSVCTVSRNFVVTPPTVSASGLVSGATITNTVNVKNNTGAAEKIVVIAAYYEDNTMLSCDFEEQQIGAGQTLGYNLSVQLPADCQGGGEFKIFVWKGYDGSTFSMIPVSDVIDPVN